MLRGYENITYELTEEELNGTPNREGPSFWPSSDTTE